ncbi:MAG: glycosyltransferase family 39 protein [Candidatus Falkowbacteria bacterium]
MNGRFYYLYIAIFLLALVLTSFIILPPHLFGDSVSYLTSIEVLKTGKVPPDFILNRILTTYAGLQTVIFFSYIFGSALTAWLFMNIVFYIIANLFFYKLLEEFFESRKIAFWGMILLAVNYAMITFGPTYLMDMGGWTSYFITIFLVFRFLKTQKIKYLVWGAFITGLGGLFKEYGFLGFIPILISLIFYYKNNTKQLIKYFAILSVFAVLPAILVHIFVYVNYHYSYLNWFYYNKNLLKDSSSGFLAYIKVFGSLFTFGWFLFVGGIYTLIKKGGEKFNLQQIIFIIALFLSIMPIFLWPGITQRIFFIAIPFIILISCVFLKKYESQIYYFVPLFIIYILANFTMDKYILPLINIDHFIQIFFK